MPFSSLRESTQTLNALIAASPLAIVIIDTEQRVQLWSPAAEQMFGWTEAEVLGKPLPIVPENEKQNVRDGHYGIWGPLHLFTLMSTNGYPAHAQAGDVIGFMTGTRPAPSGLDLVALQAQRHVVPQCAMQVSRTDEIGPMSSFAPPQSCGCYYEKVANGTTSCMPCSNKTDCPAASPFCNYGYCEAH